MAETLSVVFCGVDIDRGRGYFEIIFELVKRIFEITGIIYGDNFEDVWCYRFFSF